MPCCVLQSADFLPAHETLVAVMETCFVEVFDCPTFSWEGTFEECGVRVWFGCGFGFVDVFGDAVVVVGKSDGEVFELGSFGVCFPLFPSSGGSWGGGSSQNFSSQNSSSQNFSSLKPPNWDYTLG